MSNIQDFFCILNNFKQVCNNTNIEFLYNDLLEQLKTTNTELINLKNNNIELQNNICKMEKIIQEKEEEIASFKKSSIITSLDRKITELKNHINILESKNKSESKNIMQEIVQEEIINNNNIIKEEQNSIDNEINYETIDYKNKKHYLIKKKVYKINKDKTIGTLVGKYKNGEIIKLE